MRAVFEGMPTILPPSPATQAIMEVLQRYGDTRRKALAGEDFPEMAINHAIKEGYVRETFSSFITLSDQAKMAFPKSVHDLSESELDYFTGKALGLDVSLTCVIPGLPERGLMCCLRGTRTTYEPTVVWAEASKLLKQGVELIAPPPNEPWIAEKGDVRIVDQSPMIAICRCYVAEKAGPDEVFIVNWGQTYEPD